MSGIEARMTSLGAGADHPAADPYDETVPVLSLRSLA
jgi:hypothetical protein